MPTLVRRAGAIVQRSSVPVRRALRRLRAGPFASVLALLLALPILVSPAPKDAGAARTGGPVEVAPRESDVAAAPDLDPAATSPASDPEPAAPPPPGDGNVAAAPAPPAPVAVPDQVEVLQPDLLVRPTAPLGPGSLFAALGVPGVRHLAGGVEVATTVDAPTGASPLTVLVVDPILFRPLTPGVTAQARAVWERLLEGEMVVRHDVAERLQLPLGERVTLTGPNGTPRDVRVGAFASNGTPPLAEALVAWEVGSDLGVAGANLLVVAVADDHDPDAVDPDLAAAVGGDPQITRVQPPQPQEARLEGAGAHQFEPFTYIDHGDGMITIDPAWVAANIVSAELPVIGGTAKCHRAMMPQLIAALTEIEQQGLGHLLDPRDYGGCWVPRHMLFDPSRPISMHAWGLAVDINVHTNMYGAVPTLDHRIVEIFERWGFRWGGDFSTPDGMHFELRAVVQ